MRTSKSNLLSTFLLACSLVAPGVTAEAAVSTYNITAPVKWTSNAKPFPQGTSLPDNYLYNFTDGQTLSWIIEIDWDSDASYTESDGTTTLYPDTPYENFGYARRISGPFDDFYYLKFGALTAKTAHYAKQSLIGDQDLVITLGPLQFRIYTSGPAYLKDTGSLLDGIYDEGTYPYQDSTDDWNYNQIKLGDGMTITPVAVPVPPTLPLFAFSISGLLAFHRRRS